MAQSGAIRTSLDVLKLVMEHGDDINRRLQPNAGSAKQNVRFRKVSETPPFVGTTNGYRDVVRYGLEQWVNMKVNDLEREDAGNVGQGDGK